MKRERTLLRRAVGYQQGQLQTVVGMLQNAQAELRALKPVPSFTIKTLPDDVDENDHESVAAAGIQPVSAHAEVHD